MASVERCTNHSFEVADRLCGDCGAPFCHLCLVTPFRRKAPLCLPCAMAAAGVRKGARPAPTRSKREIKAFERERREADARPAPASPSEGGFGPARPNLTSGPSRPTTRAAASDAVDDEDGEAQEHDQEKAGSGRNRPLWGLTH